MMLQTDAHNPQVEQKMTLEQFLKLGKSFNLNDKILTEYYEDITKEPLSVPYGTITKHYSSKLAKLEPKKIQKFREKNLKKILKNSEISLKILNELKEVKQWMEC